MTICMNCFLAAILLSYEEPRSVVAQHFDLIEVNHYFDRSGKAVFDQVIYFNWDVEASRYNVVAWRLLKEPNQRPRYRPATGTYFSAWHDGKVLRKITSDEMIETWTQYDAEAVERLLFPKKNRRGLWEQ